jgi:alcohol dehydrogenase class IV
VRESDFPALVEGARGSSMRGNPVDLSDAQIEGILQAAL